MSENSAPTRLKRGLRLFDAVIVGLGAMIGAGIFAAAGPASAAAGSGLIIAILIAGLIAYLNASTMASLAKLFPESGGTYAYGRRTFGPFLGFLAGFGFVIGKIASCTAMALTFAHYVYPDRANIIASGIVLFLTAVNYFGIQKTAIATRVVLFCVLTTLALITACVLFGSDLEISRLSAPFEKGGLRGILEAAGLMFFAFAGYARLATLGEEVKEPERVIPKAIMIALAITVLVYLVVITALLIAVPIESLAQSRAPLRDAMMLGRFKWLSPIASVGAALASTGVLLSLLVGISRTVFAMAANGEMPRFLAAVHSTYRIPHRAEVMIGVIVAAIVFFADLRGAIGFSSFAILIYYAIANACALKLKREQLIFSRAHAALGLMSCFAVAANLPIQSVLFGSLLFGIGSLYYWLKAMFGKKIE